MDTLSYLQDIMSTNMSAKVGSAQEDVPVECGVDNGQGGYNRYMEVSYEEADYWPGDDEYMGYWYLEVEDESWGQCLLRIFVIFLIAKINCMQLYLWIHQNMILIICQFV